MSAIIGHGDNNLPHPSMSPTWSAAGWVAACIVLVSFEFHVLFPHRIAKGAAWPPQPSPPDSTLAWHGRSRLAGLPSLPLPPSTKLRQWFGHDPSRFEEFRRSYVEELRDQRPRLTELRRRARRGTLTLVYSARDTEHNDAVVLAEILRRGLPKAADRA